MGYPSGGPNGPKPGKLFLCVMHLVFIYFFLCLNFLNNLNHTYVGSGSKDMVLKLDSQMDKEPSLMVNSM